MAFLGWWVVLLGAVEICVWGDGSVFGLVGCVVGCGWNLPCWVFDTFYSVVVYKAKGSKKSWFKKH